MLASRRRPDLEFFVFGPRNAYVERLERGCRAKAPGRRCRFAGYVADPADAIRQVNVVVSFSLVPESFGRTIAEAMAARRPVIAYRWGAAPELVRHGIDGFLVPSLDSRKRWSISGCWPTVRDRLQEWAARPGASRAAVFARLFGSALNGIYRQIIEAWRTHEHPGVITRSAAR